MAEVVLEGVGVPISNDSGVVPVGVGTPINNNADVVPGAVGPPLNNDFFPGFGAGEPPPNAPFPGFGGAPPNIATAGAAGATGLASDAGHTHGQGPATLITENVTNNEATPLVIGEIVRINTNNGVVRSQADSTLNLQGTVGVAFSGIAAGATGPIMTLGRGTVRMAAGLVAPAPAAGQFIYVDPTTEGRGTNVAPVNALIIGVIKDAANYGVDFTVVADVSVQWEVASAAPGAATLITENVTNNEATPLVIGEIVKINANNGVIRSQSNTAANIKGTVGVAFAAVGAGAVGAIMTLGRGTVRMAAGLVAPAPAAGQYIWVDPTTEGRGTNLQPSTHGIVVGVIKDAANYGVDSTVIADVSVQWDIPSLLDRIAIGEDSNASGANAIAIGETAISSGDSAVAIGPTTNNAGASAVVIGDSASATVAAADSTVVGPDANASVGSAIVAVGSSATGAMTDAIAVGRNALSDGTTAGGIAIGADSICSSGGEDDGNIAIGAGAHAIGNESVVVGARAAAAVGEGQVVAIGALARTTAGSVAIGWHASGGAIGLNTLVIGTSAGGANVRNFDVIIGETANVGAAAPSGVVVVGQNAMANGTDTIVIGRAGGAVVNAGANCVLIGPAPTIAAAITGGVGIGQGITISSSDAIVIGRGASQVAGGYGGIAIGVNAAAAGGIAIGQSAVGGTRLCAIGAVGVGEGIEDFNVRNNLATVNTLRAEAFPTGGNNVTGLWICIRSNTGAVSLQQVTMTSGNPGNLQVANA